jgi:hypothetical protein
MSLSNASINSGATGSFSGGSALAFESRGIEAGRNVLYATADTDLRTRREIDCSVSYPKVQATAPNGYTQARSTLVIKVPIELDNGNTTVNTFRIVLSTDVETSDTQIDEMLVLGAQTLLDADFAAFWKAKSVA